MKAPWHYLNDIIAILAAISGFMTDHDMRLLARNIARILYIIVEQERGSEHMGGIERAKVVDAVESVIDAFVPAFGVDTDGDGKIDEWSDL